MEAEPPRDERLPRRCRICKREEFQHVFRRGRRLSSPSFRVVWRPNDLGYSRLGLAVSRRVGGAVVRNRVKRRLRDVFRRHREALPQRTGVDFVVIPNPPAAALDFETFRDEILGIFRTCAERLEGGTPTPRTEEAKSP